MKLTRYPWWHDFGSSVLFDLLQSNNVTTLCSTGSQQGVHVADTVNAVGSYCANVDRAGRELLQSRPHPGYLVFMRAAFLIDRFPRRFFRANALRLSLSFRCLPRFLPWFFRRVEFGTLTTPRLLRSRHFCSLACGLRVFILSSHRVSRFPRRRYTNFGTVAAGNDFALLGCVTTSRCCWQACTVSIDEFSRQSTSCRDVD